MNVSQTQIALQDLFRKFKNKAKFLRKIPRGVRLEFAKALGDLFINARSTTGPAKSFAWGKLMCLALKF